MTLDPRIMDDIRGTVDSRARAVGQLAHCQKLKRDIEVYVLKNGGDGDDALMIFHDSIVAFVKRVFSNKDFVLEGTLEGYLFGISKYMWWKKLKEKKANMPLEDFHIPEKTVANEGVNLLFFKEKRHLLHRIMDAIGKNCREVLMYWAGGYSMVEIADLLGYKSEGMVRKKKHQCWKALMTFLEDHPGLKEELAR